MERLCGEKKNTEEILPSAKNTMQAFRSFGYNFNTAVAEIIDNSIEAGANKIDIKIEFEGKNSWITIADNGRGMNSTEIREAIRFGTERDYDSDSLGKFGMGLKTASLSQCKCLTIASRNSKERAIISGYQWDYDYICEVNKWEAHKLNRKDLEEINSNLCDLLKNNTGTVVMWDRLDKILEYKDPEGSRANNRLLKMCRELEFHLGMVFHKYLSGDIKRKKVQIYLNDNLIKPWDPFVKTESKLIKMSPIEILIENEKSKNRLLIEPFILPKQADFSSTEAFNDAAGPNKWNNQQGFYIYRSGRMIQSGGWNRLRTPDEHTKYARIMIDFNPNLDDEFEINIAKMSVKIPEIIRSELKQKTESVVRKAKIEYKKSQNSITQPQYTSKSQTSWNDKEKNNFNEPSKDYLTKNDDKGTSSPDNIKAPQTNPVKNHNPEIINEKEFLIKAFSLFKKYAEGNEVKTIERIFKRIKKEN